MSATPARRTPVRIKICGITRVEDALAAIACGASMLGLNFYAPSPRCIAMPEAQAIAREVRGRAPLTGIFVNVDASELLRIVREVPLDAVQLHGDIPVEAVAALAAEHTVIRALAASTSIDPAQLSGFHGLLLDTPTPLHGGSGEAFAWNSVDWPRLRATLPHTQLFLAGGLNAANVGAAIACAQPDVVDVCSGVEASKGIKSLEIMREFVAAVRAAEGQQQ